MENETQTPGEKLVERLKAKRIEVDAMDSGQIFNRLQKLLHPMMTTDLDLRCEIIDTIIQYGSQMGRDQHKRSIAMMADISRMMADISR
tara:strand:+ start:11057 stop:11323 length:267 start_codon:yes stop_codon:yes gene_type:complete